MIQTRTKRTKDQGRADRAAGLDHPSRDARSLVLFKTEDAMSRIERSVTVSKGPKGEFTITGEFFEPFSGNWYQFSASPKLYVISRAIDASNTALKRAWKLQDALPRTGHYDWSGIRDSEPKTIETILAAVVEHAEGHVDPAILEIAISGIKVRPRVAARIAAMARLFRERVAAHVAPVPTVKK